MPAKKVITRIKVGSVSLPFWEHKEGWRWSWKNREGEWKYGTRRDYDEAVEAARARARTIHNGKLDIEAITSAQADLVRQFLALNPTSEDLRKLQEWRSRPAAVTVATAIKRWHAHKLAELGGIESRTLRGDWNWLEKFADHFAKSNAPEITTEELQSYIEAASTNAKSRKTYRARITAIWKFAQTHEIFTSSAADRLPAYKPATQRAIDILTPEQAKILLREVSPEFRGWLVLNLFSGMRAQEIVSRSEAVKPSLRWDHVRRADGVIDVPAAVSKRRKRRIMPILTALSGLIGHATAESLIATGFVKAKSCLASVWKPVWFCV